MPFLSKFPNCCQVFKVVDTPDAMIVQMAGYALAFQVCETIVEGIAVFMVDTFAIGDSAVVKLPDFSVKEFIPVFEIDPVGTSL